MPGPSSGWAPCARAQVIKEVITEATKVVATKVAIAEVTKVVTKCLSPLSKGTDRQKRNRVVGGNA